MSHVVALPLATMHLLDNHLAQCTKQESSTPVTLDTGSLEDPSQHLLPVGLIGHGNLYQIVNVCEVAILIDKYSEWYIQLWIVAPPHH